MSIPELKVHFDRAKELLVEDPARDVATEMYPAEELVKHNPSVRPHWYEEILGLFQAFPTCSYGVNLTVLIYEIQTGNVGFLENLVACYELGGGKKRIGMLGRKMSLMQENITDRKMVPLMMKITSLVAIVDWHTADVLYRRCTDLMGQSPPMDQLLQDRFNIGRKLILLSQSDREFWDRAFSNGVDEVEWNTLIGKQVLLNIVQKSKLHKPDVLILERYLPASVMPRIYGKFMNSKGNFEQQEKVATPPVIQNSEMNQPTSAEATVVPPSEVVEQGSGQTPVVNLYESTPGKPVYKQSVSQPQSPPPIPSTPQVFNTYHQPSAPVENQYKKPWGLRATIFALIGVVLVVGRCMKNSHKYDKYEERREKRELRELRQKYNNQRY